MKAHRLVRENGLVHAQAAEDARRARATRMVVRSLSSTKKTTEVRSTAPSLLAAIHGVVVREVAGAASRGDEHAGQVALEDATVSHGGSNPM